MRSCDQVGSSSSACCVAWGDPTNGPSRSRSANGARGAGEDAMAEATADARREVVADVIIVGVVGVVGTGGGAVSGVVGDTEDGWTCCTARDSVRCWPSRTEAVTPRVHATLNDLPTLSASRGMERTTRSTSTGSEAGAEPWCESWMGLPSVADDVPGLWGRDGTDVGRLRKGEEER